MIVSSDLLIKSTLNLIIQEMRNNSWLLDDVFSDVLSDPYLADTYGKKEIDTAKSWLKNNNIGIFMNLRLDGIQYPCITLALNSSSENNSEARLADQTTETETLDPSKINKPIPYIIKPFVPLSYIEGVVKVPLDIDTSYVSPGMLIVDPDTGKAWEIESLAVDNGIKIKNSPSLEISKLGVLPQYREWKARREAIRINEEWTIGLHNHGEPGPLIHFHSIILYGLLRYRETLLEARGFRLSTLRSSDFVSRQNIEEGADNIYSRYITISGLLEHSFLKSPKRVIESIVAKNPENLQESGIQICSNLKTKDDVDKTQESWVTVEAPYNKKRSITME
jgi:hypothetical protein